MKPRFAKLLSMVTRAVVALIAIIIAIVFVAVMKATAPELEQKDLDETARTVQVFNPPFLTVYRQWTGYGSARAMQSVRVPTRVTSTVTYLPDDLRRGMLIEQGQVLARLDADDFNQQVKIAKTRLFELRSQIEQLAIEGERVRERLALEEEELAVSESDLAFYRDLIRRDAGQTRHTNQAIRNYTTSARAVSQSRQQLQALPLRRAGLLTQKQVLQADLRLAQLNRQRCTITSPITGVLDERAVELGEQVQIGSMIARVVDLQRIEVPIQLPASARATVRVGDAVHLRTTTGLQRNWDATIIRIAPTDAEDQRTFAVYAVVEQPDANAYLDAALQQTNPTRSATDAALTPGTYLTARVTTSIAVERYVIPRRAIKAGRLLYVDDQSRLASVAVTTDFVLEGPQPQSGLPDDQWAVLTSDPQGIDNDSLILLNANTTVSQGQDVKPQRIETTGVASLSGSDVGGGGG